MPRKIRYIARFANGEIKSRTSVRTDKTFTHAWLASFEKHDYYGFASSEALAKKSLRRFGGMRTTYLGITNATILNA